jgi:FtsP/CotA-like multicopper oxidase with cupredoxin domain
MISLWMACTPDPVSLTTGVETSPEADGPRVPFAEPLVAEDLDPAPTVVRVALTAAPRAYPVGELVVDGYAYNDQNPGPTLRARVGDMLEVELTNALPTDTTLHWHGVSVPYAMDGVTWQADPVGPGEVFLYRFVLEHPGTFWYHPHFDSDAQVDLGLYGLLVVEDPADPPVDRELVLILDDWTEAPPTADRHGLQSFPGTWAVNGLVKPTLELAGGETMRVRVLNASNTRYLDLADVTVIGADQGLLPQALDAASLLLAPGDRAELQWRVGEEAPALETLPYSLNGGPALGEVESLLTLSVGDPLPAPAAPAWAFDPTPASEDPGTTDIGYVFSGDGDEWLINGEAYPDVTIEELSMGQVAVVEVRNLSSTEHPFHLHGMPFEVLSIDGQPPGYRQVEDTVNVRIRQTVRLRVVADNPGDWMAHCHILPHAHQGMMTVLRVSE